MKQLLVGLVAVLFAAPLVASAQTTRPADKPARETARDTKAPAWKNDAGLHETKDIIGTRIKNAEGKDLGEIDQLLIDTQTGKVSHVVVGLGGLAGVGEKKVVVPWSDLKFAPVTEGKKNAITMEQAKLESAPRYERSARAASSPSASPSTTSPSVKSPARDSDKDGKPNATDRAPYNPNKQ
jgi:sporulation protein YlmC with PRC-barrel domain